MKPELTEFHEALKAAAAYVRKHGCNVHVIRDKQERFIVSPIRPVAEERSSVWFRVGSDGRIEDGASGKRIGTLAEIGL